MKNLRLTGLLVCILMVSLLFTGCGGGGNETSQEENTEAAAAEPIKLRIAGQHPIDHIATQALNKIKERIEKETNGRIEVTLYPANQLGDYTLVYEEVMKGSIDAAHIFIPSQYDEKLEISSIPYLVTNYDEMKKVFSPGSFMYDKYQGLHKNLGVKLLGIYAEGFIGYGVKKMPDNPADPTAKKNLLVRVAPLEVYKLGAEDMGFTTTTIPYADLYTALQTGVADGWVGGTPTLNYQSFRDVIKHYLPYNSMIENTSYIMNQKLFDSLSPEDQKIVSDIFMEEALNSIDTCKAEDEMYMQKMKEAGIEVVEFTPEELNTISTHIRSVTWPKLVERFGQDIMDGMAADLK